MAFSEKFIKVVRIGEKVIYEILMTQSDMFIEPFLVEILKQFMFKSNLKSKTLLLELVLKIIYLMKSTYQDSKVI